MPSARNDVLINIDEKTRNAALRFYNWKLIVGKFKIDFRIFLYTSTIFNQEFFRAIFCDKEIHFDFMSDAHVNTLLKELCSIWKCIWNVCIVLKKRVLNYYFDKTVLKVNNYQHLQNLNNV